MKFLKIAGMLVAAVAIGNIAYSVIDGTASKKVSEIKDRNAASGSAHALDVYVGKYPWEKVGEFDFRRHPVVTELVRKSVRNEDIAQLILLEGEEAGPSEVIDRVSEKEVRSRACEKHNCSARNWSVTVNTEGGGVVCYYDEAAGHTKSGYYSEAGKAPLTNQDCAGQSIAGKREVAALISRTNPNDPSAWIVVESKDAFTDKISRQYYAEPVDGSKVRLDLGCSTSGEIGLYFHFPAQSGLPMGTLPDTAKIRIDDEAPYDDDWSVLRSLGSSYPKKSVEFMEKIKGRSKLAIDVYAGGRGVFNIRGFDAALASMKEVGCSKEK